MLYSQSKMLLPDKQILSVRNLSVNLKNKKSPIPLIKNVSFNVNFGETLAIIGESGSGKSVISLSIMQLIEFNGGYINSGKLFLRRSNGEIINLLNASKKTLQKIRGADVAMIFQEPKNALNPSIPIIKQITECIHTHKNKSNIIQEALQMLELMHIPNAKTIMNYYPYQLSGGMCQRVMIAMALLCKPKLLIADAPTSALDTKIQAQILKLIKKLQQEIHMGIIFITHDMSIVAEISDNVLVMHKGNNIELASTNKLFYYPSHPYTKTLLSIMPHFRLISNINSPIKKFNFHINKYFKYKKKINISDNYYLQNSIKKRNSPILEVKNLITRFNVQNGIFGRIKNKIHAVEKISFFLYPGETLSFIGESGCGKSTVGRSLLQLVETQNGKIIFNGQLIDFMQKDQLKYLRKNIQLISQDSYAALDPRLKIGYSIIEPILIHKTLEKEKINSKLKSLLKLVGLSIKHAYLYPHEFSSGQKQLICIARALSINPKIIIADESITSLDIFMKMQILNLILDLQEKFNIAFLFISHDIAIVERITHRIAVMHLGQIIEIGSKKQIFEFPKHPYTCKLIESILSTDPMNRRLNSILKYNKTENGNIYESNYEPKLSSLVEVEKGHYVAY